MRRYWYVGVYYRQVGRHLMARYNLYEKDNHYFDIDQAYQLPSWVEIL